MSCRNLNYATKLYKNFSIFVTYEKLNYLQQIYLREGRLICNILKIRYNFKNVRELFENNAISSFFKIFNN